MRTDGRVDQATHLQGRWLYAALVSFAADLAWDIRIGWHANPWETWLLLLAWVAYARFSFLRGWLAGYRDARQ